MDYTALLKYCKYIIPQFIVKKCGLTKKACSKGTCPAFKKGLKTSVLK
jgi:hypothetical protein